MIVKQFFIKDLKNYETDTGDSVIKLFNEFDIRNLLILISLGNGCCSIEDASIILDNYLIESEENSVISALQDIRKCLLGETASETDDTQEGIDITKYRNITALYNEICSQLMSSGINWSEFWDMTTTDIYLAYDGIRTKNNNELNKELAMYHNLAHMVGAAVWGKLGNEIPRVSEEPENRIIETEEYGEIDLETYNAIANLEALKRSVG